MTASTDPAAPSAALQAPAAAPPFVWPVVQQHVEETAHLRHVRGVLVRAPHVALNRLARLDERIAAHVDGMVVNAPAARRLALQEFDTPSVGTIFAAAALALLTRDAALFDHLGALAPVLPEAARGLVSALGWVEPAVLRGTVRDLLGAKDAALRRLGIEACVLHRVDPGAALDAALRDADDALRASALGAAATLGRADLAAEVERALAAAEAADAATSALAAAFAASRFGLGARALPLCQRLSALDGEAGLRALRLGLSSAPPEMALELGRHWGSVARAGDSPLAARRALQSVALLGQPGHVPWLIERMAEPTLARLVGEAFSWITGADLAEQDLETLQAPPLPETPTDDPDAPDVGLDDDESLPWPDVAKVERWWSANAARFTGIAAPVFMGRSAHDEAALVDVLRHGRQRQRHHAAWLLGLRRPGTPLFPVSAPVPRQLALLAQYA